MGEEKYVLCFGEKVIYVSKNAFLVSVRQIFECKDLDGLDEKTKKFAMFMQRSFRATAEDAAAAVREAEAGNEGKSLKPKP